MLGIAAVRLSGYFEDVPVNLPQVESETPIIIRLCPESESGKGYIEGGYLYFSQEKAINCTCTTGSG